MNINQFDIYISLPLIILSYLSAQIMNSVINAF